VGEREAADFDRHFGTVTRTIRNLKAAREEFSSAVSWYEEQRPGLGANFLTPSFMQHPSFKNNPKSVRRPLMAEPAVCWSSDFRIKSYTAIRRTKLLSLR
jgi:hypothetical protein